MSKKIKWDVSHEEFMDMAEQKNAFFDPRLSYETSGYRPITETDGLDFNPDWFTEATQRKQKEGRFCPYSDGTIKCFEFWKEEHKRCRHGYTVNGYTLTGDMYFFVNYYRLLNVSTAIKAGGGRDYTAPSFWAEHYKYSHYVELAKKGEFDVCLFKSRGVGASEYAASCGANMYTVVPSSKSLYTASMEHHLLGTGVLSKVYDCLEFLNQETEGGMRRVSMKKNEPMWRKASVVDKKGQESGHMAEIFGKIVDNPRKIRGARVESLYFEEAGSYPSLLKAYTQAEALVELLGKKIGVRYVFGTGGDAGAGIEGLETMFLNPTAFNILPYYNNINELEEYVYTGYFIPAYACYPPAMDNRGVTNKEAAIKVFERKREIAARDPKGFIMHCAEFPFYPEEALSQQGENEFDQARISEQVTQIKMLKTIKEPIRGNLFWKYADGVEEPIGVDFIPDNNGKVKISEMPIKDEDGSVIKGLYVAGIDGIDLGSGDSSSGEGGSKFCITIKKRTFGNQGNAYVASYIDRPKDVRTAYEIALQLQMLFECKANLEDSKIGYRMWLTEKKLLHKYLMKRPMSAMASGKRSKSTLWGTQPNEKNIRHGLELITQFIDDYCANINDIEMLEQMQRFKYANKGKFDIIMAMVMTEIADEDMMGIVAKQKDKEEDWGTNIRIGYYTDGSGRKRFGVIGNDEYNTIGYI